jgi:hypothetical protein
MIDANSRYRPVGTATIEAENGRKVLYLRRRMLPQGSEILSTRTIEATADAQRLDLISWSVSGDAFGFWRICDANDGLDPFELVHERNGRLRVPSGAV